MVKLLVDGMERGSSTEEWLRGHEPIENGASLDDGTEVGRWRIVAFVARGGAGEVYRAVEVNGERTAALKILHRTDTSARTRFEREAQVLSELQNPSFPAFFESGEYKGHPWYATEFLQPLDLPTTDAAVARLVRAICRGAGALHARGFVHRDIKPANILSHKGEPVLIDLGLLKRAETPALHPGGTISVVDGRPVGVGTPGYAAPEQFLGGEISPAADIHAIGVLASTCFGGKPPRAWRKIIRRATSSLPAERYPDVASLARAVRMRHLPATLGVAAVVAVMAAAMAMRMAMVGGPKGGPEGSVAGGPPALPEAMQEGNIAGGPPAPPEVSQTVTEENIAGGPPAPPEVSQTVTEVSVAGGPPAPPEVPQTVTEGSVAGGPPALPEVPQTVTERSVAGEPPAPPETLSEGDTPIVASERMRQKLADQGKNLPLVTPNEIRRAVGKLESGMVAIPGRDFEICKFEITQEIWMPIAGFNPSEKKGEDLPVSNMTLSDIEEFLDNLNALPEVRVSGKKYRLPTAEEWEYACLAGGTNGFCRLADGTQITEETLGAVAWFGLNSGDAPHSVCRKKPNAFGLYDMHGNVAEWTSTKAPGEMFEYICKGNAYNGKKPQAFRADFSPHITHGLSFFSLGFRVVR